MPVDYKCDNPCCQDVYASDDSQPVYCSRCKHLHDQWKRHYREASHEVAIEFASDMEDERIDFFREHTPVRGGQTAANQKPPSHKSSPESETPPNNLTTGNTTKH